jgi:hypothetical protein
METSVRDLGSVQIGLRLSTSEQQSASAFRAFCNATYQVEVGQAVDSAQLHGQFRSNIRERRHPSGLVPTGQLAFV